MLLILFVMRIKDCVAHSHCIQNVVYFVHKGWRPVTTFNIIIAKCKETYQRGHRKYFQTLYNILYRMYLLDRCSINLMQLRLELWRVLSWLKKLKGNN